VVRIEYIVHETDPTGMEGQLLIVNSVSLPQRPGMCTAWALQGRGIDRAQLPQARWSPRHSSTIRSAAQVHQSTPHCSMSTTLSGTSCLSFSCDSISRTTAMPSPTTSPNTTCLPSKCGALALPPVRPLVSALLAINPPTQTGGGGGGVVGRRTW
jgi:hypothetical protein